MPKGNYPLSKRVAPRRRRASRSPDHGAARGWTALASALLLVVAIAGCGESSTTSVASAPASTVETSSATSTTTSTTPPASTGDSKPAATANHHGRSAQAKARARAAFSSLASAKPQHKLTPEQRASLPVSDIQLTSLGLHAGSNATIAREYTCRGANRSPALRWQNIPSGTAEIAIFAISAEPVAGKLFFDWSVTGINPKLDGLPAGKLPAGAVAGRNGYGKAAYSICPPTDKPETYVFAVYALPHKIAAAPGYDPAALRAEIRGAAHHTGLIIATSQP